jgi:hypothetical protein
MTIIEPMTGGMEKIKIVFRVPNLWRIMPLKVTEIMAPIEIELATIPN